MTHEETAPDALVVKTVGSTLDDAAEAWPDSIGWTLDDTDITFAEMKDLVDRVAGGLAGLHVSKGDTVALWMPNIVEWVATAFACYRLGAIVVPLNTRFRAFETEYVLKSSQAKVLVLQNHFLKYDYGEILRQAAPDIEVAADGSVTSEVLPDLRHVVTVDEGSLGGIAWSRLAEAEPIDAAAAEAALTPQDPCLLQYTSGTTGRPKGALLSQTYVRNFAVELWSRIGVQPHESFLNPQPFYHVGGSCTLTVPPALGCRIVIPASYSPEAVLELIQRHRCVARGGMSTMYLMELNHPRFDEFDTSSLRAGWTSAAPADMDRIRDGYGIEMIQLYGATEGGGTSGRLSDPWSIRRSTNGVPYSNSEIKLLDPETGEEVEVGQPGEALLRGSTMLRYYRDEERTREVLDDDGWLRIGDLLRQDESGNFSFVGRLKDMIRVGGENTSAEEVEWILVSHPEINLAQVIGVPDTKMGEAVYAFVERTAGSELSEPEIAAFVKERAANFRVPKYVEFVESDDWPMTGSGKIAKNQLREALMADFTERVDAW